MISTTHTEKYGNVKYCTELYHFNYQADIRPDFRSHSWERSRQPGGKFVAITRHNHEESEFIYLKRGRLYATLGDENFTVNSGDLMLVDPFELHAAQFDNGDDIEYRYLVFNTDHLSGCGSLVSDRIAALQSGKYGFRKIIRAEEPVVAELGGIMDDLGALSRDSAADDLMAVSLLCRFMSLIFEKVGLGTTHTARNTEFIIQVNRFINENFSSDITTASISATFGYSKNFFCSLFKTNFGQTFSNYLTDYRLNRAMTAYRNSHLRLSEIAEAVGFGDYCYFSRRFRQNTGISPSAYFRGAD